VFFPTFPCSLPSNRFSLSSGELLGSRFAADDSALTPRIHLGGILAFVWVWGWNLGRRNVHNKLGEFIGVARSLTFADGHETIMPQVKGRALRPVDFKL
jgi:hypothetical protein